MIAIATQSADLTVNGHVAEINNLVLEVHNFGLQVCRKYMATHVICRLSP